MKRTLLVIALAALAILWTQQKLSTDRLTAELIRLRRQQGEVAALLRERERLHQRVSEAEKFEATAQEFAGPANEASPVELATSFRPTLPPGDWTTARTWGFRGQATPQATIESALWACAGGDMAALKQLLSVSDATRAIVADLLTSLPASSRMTYSSADDLISALTIKRIPLGEAQLVWLNQNGPDDASACVFLKEDPQNPSNETQPEPVLQDRDRAAIPPQLPPDRKTVAAYLALQREGGRWRLVVPPTVVGKWVQDLSRAPKSGS